MTRITGSALASALIAVSCASLPEPRAVSTPAVALSAVTAGGAPSAEIMIENPNGFYVLILRLACDIRLGQASVFGVKVSAYAAFPKDALG